MKTEKLFSFLSAAVLSFVISFGAAGCLVSGFQLNLENPTVLLLCCLCTAILSAGLLQCKYGSHGIGCILALICGYLWHRGIAAEQFLSLVYRISYVYDSAYGWGVLRLTEDAWNAGLADYPVAIFGGLIALAVSITLCRRKSAWLAVIPALTLLLPCLVVTDTVPGELSLFLLIVGLSLLILTNTVRRENAAQGLRLMAMAAIPVLLAVTVLFLSIPRRSYVNRTEAVHNLLAACMQDFPSFVESTGQELALSLHGGTQETVNLKTIGPKVNYTYPVMEVTSQEGGRLYLRGQHYDHYDGTGWTSTAGQTEHFFLPGTSAGSVTVRTRGHRTLLYLPYYPGEETVLTGGLLENTGNLRQYTLQRQVLPENWEDTVLDADHFLQLSPSEQTLQAMQPYLMLPQQTRSRAQELLNGLTGNSATEKARIIASLVRSSAEYDLNTPRMPETEGDFALWFLREADTGYCVHFATAATVLLRAADIPARYVTGYLTEAATGQTVTVTAKDAHAWAEYYEPALDCWMILEATPSGAAIPVPLPQSTAEPQTAPAPAEVPTQPEIPEHPTTAETTPSPSAPTETEAPRNSLYRLKGIAAMLFSLGLSLLALTLQRFVRLQLRQNARRNGDPNTQALACWQETELLSRLLKQAPPEELLHLANKAKFSQHTITPEERHCFDSYLRCCRQLLREKPWYIRLIHQYLFAAY